MASLGTMGGAAALGVFFLSSSLITVPVLEPLPTGTIAGNDREFCKRVRFDDSGRVFRDVVPCDGASAGDARGEPVGTRRRLDAISKSFSGH